MVIVDTSVWVDYLRGCKTPQVAWLDAQLSIQQIGLTSLILFEILQGVRHEQQAHSLLQHFQAFTVYDAETAAMAVQAAANYRLLRARGRTVRSSIDTLTATFCIAQGHILLHSDRDFDGFEQHLGLRVLHPRLNH